MTITSSSTSGTRFWATSAAETFLAALCRLGDDQYDAPSAMPGVTRAEVVASVIADADDLGNLVCASRLGINIPFAPVFDRAVGIDRDARLGASHLWSAVTGAISDLVADMDRLTEAQWRTTVSASPTQAIRVSEVPWRLARMLWLRTVDLGTGLRFEDLGPDVLSLLCDDASSRFQDAPAAAVVVTAGRNRWSLPGVGDAPHITCTLAEAAAYLTGRHRTLRCDDGSFAPMLQPLG